MVEQWAVNPRATGSIPVRLAVCLGWSFNWTRNSDSKSFDTVRVLQYAHSMICRVCSQDKEESAFSIKVGTTLHKICKSCKNAYNKIHYKKVAARHKAQVKKSTALRAIRHLKAVDKIKEVPCLDCKQSFPPYVMDFDHRPDEVKSFTVSEGISRNLSMKKIMIEIAKCDAICANCHRIRTYQRRLKSGGSRRDR